MEFISASDDDDNVVMFCCRLFSVPNKKQTIRISLFLFIFFCCTFERMNPKKPNSNQFYVVVFFCFCVHQFIIFVFRAFVSKFILYFVNHIFVILHQIINFIIGMCFFTSFSSFVTNSNINQLCWSWFGIRES